MKKLVPTVLALATALLIVGCGDKKDSYNATPTPSAKTETSSVAVVEIKKAATEQELFNEALKLHGFNVGEGKGVMSNYDMVVFFDPQCPHCGTFWNTAKLFPQLKAKWVPVALMNAKSKLDGSTILSSANPAEAMDKHESVLLQSQGLPESELTDKMTAQVLHNTDYFAVNLTGFPTIVYRTPDNKYGILKGAVDGVTLMQTLGIESVDLKTADSSSEVSKPAETAVEPIAEPVKAEDTPKVEESVKPTETVAEPVKETGTVTPKEIIDAAKEADKTNIKK